MNDARFDRLAAAWASDPSRRHLLGTLLGTALAGLLGWAETASGKKKCPKNRRCGNKCCKRDETCQKGKCVNHCKDGKKNRGETDKDCGGGDCDPCAIGKKCDRADDCLSGICRPSAATGDRRCQECARDDDCTAESTVCCNGACCTGCCGGDGSCRACLVFTTSSTHNGNLGGLLGADQICQGLADGAPTPLPGSYKAWLSTGTGANESPSTRFRRSALGYKRVDGVTVADSWDDLTDGSIDNPIFAMEDGSPVPPPTGNVLIWTNTGADGAEVSSEPRDCDNWTSPDNGEEGRLGMADPIVTDENWTELGSVQVCGSDNLRLYCFQQE